MHHRVYFDSNEGTETNLYSLWLDKSKEDLAKIPGGPKEGMKVIIYMIGGSRDGRAGPPRESWSLLLAPLQADGPLLRRKYALIYRAGFLNKTGPVEVPLRDELNNFAHVLTKARNSEETFRQ